MTSDEHDMIDILEEDYQEKLTQWETNFLAEIADHETLTANQHDKLEEIFDRVRDL